MSRKRYKKLLMSYRLPPYLAEQLADVRRQVVGWYGMQVHLSDEFGYLAFAEELEDLGYVPTITAGVMWMGAAGLRPPAVRRAK